jgi:flavodoxin
MIEALDARDPPPTPPPAPWPGVYALFCGLIAVREALRGRARRREAAALSQGAGEPVLVAFASQTGFAEELAKATAKALSEAGAPVTLRELSAVTAADLTGRPRLFVVSTTGEGDAPDPARAFIRDVMRDGVELLPALRYGVLALGDSTYANYCAFGRALDAWLARRGATSLFDRVEVDDGDPAALRHWQGQLGLLTGVTDAPDWSRPSLWPLDAGRAPPAQSRQPRRRGLAHPARTRRPLTAPLGSRRHPGDRPAQQPGRGRGACAPGPARLGRRDAVGPAPAARARRRRGPASACRVGGSPSG